MLDGLLAGDDWDVLRPLLRVHRPRAAHDVPLLRPQAPALHRGRRRRSGAARSSQAYQEMDRDRRRGDAEDAGRDAILMVVSDHGFASFRRSDELQHLAGEERLHGAHRRGAPSAQEPRGPLRPGRLLHQRRLVEDPGLRHGPGQHLHQPQGPRGARASSSPGAEYAALVAARSRQELEAFVDAETGEKPVAHVFTRDEAYGDLRPGADPRPDPLQQRGLPRRLAGQPGRHRQGDRRAQHRRSGAATTARSTRRWSTASCSATASSTSQPQPYMGDVMPTMLEHLRRPAADEARRPEPAAAPRPARPAEPRARRAGRSARRRARGRVRRAASPSSRRRRTMRPAKSAPRGRARADPRRDRGALERGSTAHGSWRPGSRARSSDWPPSSSSRSGGVAEAEAAREVARARVAEAEARIARLEGELAEERRAARARVAGLYRLGRHGYLRLAFSLEPGEDPVPAIRLLRYLARRDARRRSSDSSGLRAELASERTALEQRHAEASRLGEPAGGAARRARPARGRQVGAPRRHAEREPAARRPRHRAHAARGAPLDAARLALRPRREALAGRPIQEFRGAARLAGARPGDRRLRAAARSALRHPRAAQRRRHRDAAGRAGARGLSPARCVYAGAVRGLRTDRGGAAPGARLHALRRALEALPVAQGRSAIFEPVVGARGHTLYFEIRDRQPPRGPARWLR